MNLTKAQLTLLTTINAAGGNGTYVAENSKPLAALLENKLVETNAAIKNDKGEIAVRMTADGILVITGDTPVQKALDAETPEGTTEILVVEGVPIPASPRGRRAGSSQYPFATMEVGQSFFIAATEDKPDPFKAHGSIVSRANRHYSHEHETERTPKGNPVRVQDRNYVIRRIEDGAPWGFEGVAGAAIWREM